MNNQLISHHLNLNYFALFNLELSFNVNLNQLKSKYFALQQQFHPDCLLDQLKSNQFNANELNQLTQLIEILSTYINEAYNILKQPLLRAIALLQLNNIQFDLANQQLPHEFLIKHMEKCDIIDDAICDLQNLVTSNKCNNTNEHYQENQSLIHNQLLINIKNEINDEITILINEIADNFNNNNFAQLKILITRLSFNDKLQQRLEQSIRNLKLL